MSNMKEKMHTGELYFPDSEEITKEQRFYQDLLYEYNQTRPSETEKRAELLKKYWATAARACILRHLFMLILAGITVILATRSMRTTT